MLSRFVPSRNGVCMDNKQIYRLVETAVVIFRHVAPVTCVRSVLETTKRLCAGFAVLEWIALR